MIASARLHRAVALIAFVPAFCGICPACDPVDGTETYALWEVCEHPAGAFHFHYLEPPWEMAPGFSTEEPVFLLDPSSDPSGQADDPGARVRLEAYASEADSVADEAAARRARWIEDGYIVDAPETFSNRAGDVGVIQRASSGESRVAEVFFEAAGVAALSLWGAGSIGGEDYRLLLESFEPRGSGAH
jgi:hypothetical protein